MNHPLSVDSGSLVPVYDFSKKLREHHITLRRGSLDTLQLNLGKRCNQACHHCHVDAGPKRTESMNERTVKRVLAMLEKSPQIALVDMTGGAPELNPHFRLLVEEISRMGKKVMDRCNLTILQEKHQETLAQFLKDYCVEIVASLPCYTMDNTDKQRGDGVFERSIQGLRQLNALGYGKPESQLVLNLVYNPGGAFLPPPQASLEQTYKTQLWEQFGIEFNHLYTLTNLPISRFARQLSRDQQLEVYMEKLLQAFNPHTVEGLMCRNLISVSWNGTLHDCDFNQMLDIAIPGKQTTLWDLESFNDFQETSIATGSHCFGCTAGAGSSCGGSLV